ncbi:MerR family transcriptional regulator [Lacticaseibacillus pabuli]|uniref:MerR family transcriptional regulator n=1 Tax=Lacticaseibacillus pabuli TaxID=3025672 RepID=A0ABY7WS90_9LACO|nr:MerR family transcriptional regulator [Lacticaseibacillus sp. KACC 23028]WDF83037.1 MerR family transcriptional regulator [Lacticaseibacillus sp. KACC 23028]
MLSIRKFADLAGTTRRTLLFYDEQNLFKPASVKENGYRYYEYDQLYQLNFILQLRRLGLSIAEIKTLTTQQSGAKLDHSLDQVLADIQVKIQEMTTLQATLLERYRNEAPTTAQQLYTPCIVDRPSQKFWSSLESVGCTDAAISALYKQFYALISPLKLVDKTESGFLTDLSGSDAKEYPNANFRIIKAVSQEPTTAVPIITRPQGKYVVATATNSTTSIEKALDAIKAFISRNHLEIATNYWQLNESEQLTSKAGSARISIEYQLI